MGLNPTPWTNRAGALVCRDRQRESVISTATARCQSRNEFLPVARPCAVKGIKRGAPVLLLGSVTILPKNLQPPPLSLTPLPITLVRDCVKVAFTARRNLWLNDVF